MAIKEPRDLSPEDKLTAFKRATCCMEGAPERWRQRAETGLTDAQLIEALCFEIGIMGGRSGPGEISTEYQRNGLKIWASWNHVCPRVDCKPIFQGAATMRMAREVYAIKDPSDTQLALF